MAIRNLSKMRTSNDGTRSLFESAMLVELISALQDWSKSGADCVLVGGLGVSFHVKPRFTQDIDFLVVDEAAIPVAVEEFERTGPFRFVHGQTNIEIKIVTPERLQVPTPVSEVVIRSATVSDGVRIATASGLTALKLFWLNLHAKADIVALIKTGRVNLTAFSLSADRIAAYEELVETAKTDSHPS
jgi:hypothetical protein